MLYRLFNIAILNGLTPPEDINKPSYEKIIPFIIAFFSIAIMICIVFVIKEHFKNKK